MAAVSVKRSITHTRYFLGNYNPKNTLETKKTLNYVGLYVCIMIEIFQVWLAVYQLLMNEDCQRKYEFNSYSKEQILKVT